MAPNPRSSPPPPDHPENVAPDIKGISLPTIPAPPRPCLTTDALVDRWEKSDGFQCFWGWIRRRCERIKGKEVMRGPFDGSVPGIKHLMEMLDTMTEWVEEAPPEPQSNQRFGNLAFRTYNKLLQERLPSMLESFNLPPHLFTQLLPLFLNSHAFGHPTRLDYGTGHELAFVIGLWVCVVAGWVGGEGQAEEQEDELILRVFTRYLELTTLLQKTYKLEPAGSHGVWGLDDYCFLPYLFGSAQLLDFPLTPSAALTLATAHHPDSSASPPLPMTDLYTISLHHLTLFKSGAAFSEHSPLLFELSTMPSWTKPHSGLRKMFLGEVVGKRVVVQGLWVGGWAWGEGVPDVLEKEDAKKKNVPGVAEGSTKAPWAR
ncbi:serine/threonine-protein phosphatase 2A activator 1 [Cryptococcus sp. DSM 104549]